MKPLSPHGHFGFMEEGQDLVAAGFAGLSGTRMILNSRNQDLRHRFSEEYLETLAMCGGECGRIRKEEFRTLKYWKSFGAAEFEPAGEGGILTALWNLSGAYRLGVEFSLKKIPIMQGTIEICEFFGLNPYRLHSDGCWVLVSENGGRTVARLEEKGIRGAVIGSVTGGIARVITDVGERSFLNRPQPDELEKVMVQSREQVSD